MRDSHRNPQSAVLVVVCGEKARIPELGDLERGLRERGYAFLYLDAMEHVVEQTSDGPPLNRIIMLVHYPSFVCKQIDARSYQALLRGYLGVKKALDTRGIQTNLILFSHREDGPLVGGWDYPITAYVAQDADALFDFVERARRGIARERQLNERPGNNERTKAFRNRGKLTD